jgi:chorismate mutase
MVEKKLENLGLDSYRQELDLIDEDLKRLLNKRAEIAQNIAKIKLENNLPIYHPSREVEILRNLANSDNGKLNIVQIWSIWRSIINVNTSIQAPLDIMIHEDIGKLEYELIINNFGLSNNIIISNSLFDYKDDHKNTSSTIKIVSVGSKSLLDMDSHKEEVIGSLPQLYLNEQEPKLYIIGKSNKLKTFDDTLLFRVETNEEISVQDSKSLEMISNFLGIDEVTLQKFNKNIYVLSIRLINNKAKGLCKKIQDFNFVNKSVFIGRYATPLKIGEKIE